MLALGFSGCTTSGPSLLESAAQDIAPADAASDQAKAETIARTDSNTTGQPVNKPADKTTGKTTGETLQSAAAENAAPASQPISTANMAGTPTAADASGTSQTNDSELAAAQSSTEPATQPGTLAALFGTRTKPTAALAAMPVTTPSDQATIDSSAAKQAAQTNTQQTDSQPATAPSKLDRTSQSAGAAARLFAPGKNSLREPTANAKPAVIAGLPQKSTKDYNFTLPGVRANGGVEIRHSNKVFDESDIDLDEDDFSAPVTMASAGGMARLAPNGLRTQHSKVQVSCLKPQLVSMIKRLETHYRKPVVITSGYRSPAHNRSVSGAKRSLHMSCSAADLQIPGVSKWEIARHVRSWPSRGGVGTYCHTESVHIDVGPERDWNWRCRRG